MPAWHWISSRLWPVSERVALKSIHFRTLWWLKMAWHPCPAQKRIHISVLQRLPVKGRPAVSILGPRRHPAHPLLNASDHPGWAAAAPPRAARVAASIHEHGGDRGPSDSSGAPGPG